RNCGNRRPFRRAGGWATIARRCRIDDGARTPRPTRRSGAVSADKPKVAVTRVIPEAGLRLVRDATDMRLWEEELPPSPGQLAELLHGCDGAITLLTDRIDGDLLDREPQL